MDTSISSFNGLFFSIFQFTGTIGGLTGGFIIYLKGDKAMFIVMTIASLIALIILLYVPSIPPLDDFSTLPVIE